MCVREFGDDEERGESLSAKRVVCVCERKGSRGRKRR